MFLSPNGVFYMVLIKENKPDEIAEVLKGVGFVSEVSLFKEWIDYLFLSLSRLF